ncbi:MAG TPA: TonB-dependent receptor plug domain-containing protein, partial [Nitrospiria bacterium]
MRFKIILIAHISSLFFYSIPKGFAETRLPEEIPTLYLDPIIITGSNLPSPKSKADLSLTVISEERIEAEQEVSATELLRHVPGLHIDQPGGRGGVGSVYIRGGDPNYTLVLIDGIRVNDPTNSRGGSFDFSSLNQDGIERIEVVRGGFSPIYGSDAMAGVVHMLTRRGSGKPTMGLEVSGGLYETYRLGVQAQGAYRFFDYSLSGSVHDSGKAVPGDRLFNETYHSKFGFRPEKWNIQTVFRFQSSEMESYPNDSGGDRFSVIRTLEFRESEAFSMGTDASYPIFNKWNARIHFDYLDRDETIDSPGVAPGIRDPFGIPQNFSDNRFQRMTLRQDNVVEVREDFQFTLGVEGQLEEGEHRGHLLVGNTIVPTQFRLESILLAPFIEFQMNPRKEVFLTASARWDVPEDFKSQISHRFGFSYSLPVVR